MRWVLAWIGCALALAFVACEDEPTPPTPAPEPQPAATATAEPTATASPAPASAATPEPTPTRTQTPSPTAEPAPERTPTATPEPSPTAPPIEATPITRGDPRPLPKGLALYYWTYDCSPCDSRPIDLRRLFIDEAVGALREDRPLAFFDGVGDEEHYSPVGSFGVSESGQTIAATVCHAAVCEVNEGTVNAESGPSADTELRLWVTHDGGATWEDWGELLPQTWIVEVTDDDVLVRTSNFWSRREFRSWLTDDEWDEMLDRFAPLGLGQLDGRKHVMWVKSGEPPTWSPLPSPPSVEGVDSWYRLDDPSSDAVAWHGWAEDSRLLALADESGTVERMYSSMESVWGWFIADDLLAVPSSPEFVGGRVQSTLLLDLVDLTTATIHEVDGLSLRLRVEPEEERWQRGWHYRLTAARPMPTASMAQAPAEYVPLTLGDPRPLPAGVEMYFADWPKEGFANDVTRVVAGSDGFVTDRPWAAWDDSSAYVTSFQVSDDGRTMAAAVCEQGWCEDCYSGPSEDASLHLRVSRDGGSEWEDWGELPQGAYIEAVTEDDVAVTAWFADPTSDDGLDGASRLWWFQSGEHVAPPVGLDRERAQSWRWRSGIGFVWGYGGKAHVTDSGAVLVPPPPVEPSKKSGYRSWYLGQVRRDGWSLWMQYGEDAELFALMDHRGAVATAFTWEDDSTALGITGFLSAELAIGQLGPRPWWDPSFETLTVLVDLAAHSVHPVADLDEVAIDDCLCLWKVRLAADGQPAVVADAEERPDAVRATRPASK